MSNAEIILKYGELGFNHVIPLGFDHILFILSIFLLNSNLKSVLIQCTIFTIAHSLSLGLSAAGYIIPDAAIIEPVIAFSIVITSVQNILNSPLNNWRMFVIFVFGLIHGLGFARVLNEIGVPDSNFIVALIAFNIGVEIGQITIILAAWLLISRVFSKKTWYKDKVVYPLSAMISCIALYWTIERLI